MKLSWIYLALAATAMAEEDERGQKVKNTLQRFLFWSKAFRGYSKETLLKHSILPWKYKKAGRFEKLLVFARSYSIVIPGSVSLVRKHTTPFPLFLILTVQYSK